MGRFVNIVFAALCGGTTGGAVYLTTQHPTYWMAFLTGVAAVFTLDLLPRR